MSCSDELPTETSDYIQTSSNIFIEIPYAVF